MQQQEQVQAQGGVAHAAGLVGARAAALQALGGRLLLLLLGASGQAPPGSSAHAAPRLRGGGVGSSGGAALRLRGGGVGSSANAAHRRTAGAVGSNAGARGGHATRPKTAGAAVMTRPPAPAASRGLKRARPRAGDMGGGLPAAAALQPRQQEPEAGPQQARAGWGMHGDRGGQRGAAGMWQTAVQRTTRSRSRGGAAATAGVGAGPLRVAETLLMLFPTAAAAA
jgi:hypothetical protein